MQNCNMVMRAGASRLRDPGVEANARLTGYVALVLVVLLAAETATGLGVRGLLLPHALIGFLLIPPVLLKLGSVEYRFVRYYAREPRYRAAGPPRLGMRLLGPVVVLLTIVLFGSLVLGAVLAIAMLPLATPFSPAPGA